MGDPLILANAGDFTVGRHGHKVIRICFHRDDVYNATAVGEATYFSKHNLGAGAGAFVDYLGNACQSVPVADHSYSTAQYDEDDIAYSIEIGGKQGSPVLPVQIAKIVQMIKANPILKAVPLHRLTLAEIPPRKVGGYENHKDVTLAYHQAGMTHMDCITEAEMATILKELALP